MSDEAREKQEGKEPVLKMVPPVGNEGKASAADTKKAAAIERVKKAREEREARAKRLEAEKHAREMRLPVTKDEMSRAIDGIYKVLAAMTHRLDLTSLSVATMHKALRERRIFYPGQKVVTEKKLKRSYDAILKERNERNAQLAAERKQREQQQRCGGGQCATPSAEGSPCASDKTGAQRKPAQGQAAAE